MTENNQAAASEDDQDVGHVGVGAYVALIITILFFSGLFYNIDGYKWLGSFDFTTLAGGFGKIDGLTYIGKGGFGARQGFLFALSLFPSVMLALGVMEVVTYYGAMRAAQKLMTPLLNPILGVPGSTGLALITDLQSTDAGAALTKGMYDRGLFDKKGLIVVCAWQYSGAGLIGNYFASGSALFAATLCPLIVPLILMIVLKFVGGFLVRCVLNTVYRQDCGPFMALFGLPGQAITVLLAAWLSASAGAGMAASLLAQGVLDADGVTVILPAIFLMASQIQYMGRLLGVADCPKRYWPLLMLNSIVNALLSMWIMRLLMPFFS